MGRTCLLEFTHGVAHIGYLKSCSHSYKKILKLSEAVHKTQNVLVVSDSSTRYMSVGQVEPTAYWHADGRMLAHLFLLALGTRYVLFVFKHLR